METPNVNNLNGVPNFGHGFEEETVVETPAETSQEPESAKSEAEDAVETENEPQ